MNDVLLLATAIFLPVFAILYANERSKRDELKAAKREIKESRKREIKTAKRLADAARLDSQELIEIIQEQTATSLIESDKWSFQMPYGKWAKFDAVAVYPPAKIRGFWPDAESRIIGVKMPRGCYYEMHRHNWVEILIGISGVVTVEIQNPDGFKVTKTLGPDNVVVIPPRVDHAVLKAKEDAEFLCIWGQPS